MDKEKLATPIALVIVAFVLGLSFIIVQANKQSSIEEQKKEDTKLELLKIKQEECAGMLSGLKNKWGNIIGIKYSELYGECVVTYNDPETDNVTNSPLSWMTTAE